MTTRSMTVSDARDTAKKNCWRRPYKLRTILIISALACLVLISALCGFLIGRPGYKTLKLDVMDPVYPLPPSPSRLHVFKKAAVCTDAPVCSEIGRKILAMDGSAVDATIAAAFCNGFHNHQSMGIGGGFFMTVYIKKEQKAYTVNAREKAPAAAFKTMFKGNHQKAFSGPLASGVPGEVRGLWAAHKRWGKLPWESLLKPTLDICKNGFNMSKILYDGLEVATKRKDIKNDPNIREMYFDTKNNQFHKPGTLIIPSKALCNTLKIIAKKGGDELYNGSLAVDFIEDLQRVGSIITAEDLRKYQPKITEPITVSLGGGDVLYTPPPPSSGAILVNILNILSGYNFTPESVSGTNNTVLTYHRILEAFKYAYAARTKLGDEDFLDLKEFIQNITSSEFGTEVRLKINDTMTSNDTAHYGATEYTGEDSGTAHISILADNGDAVSMTSSINFYYGAGYSTLNTGIVMNNVMDDFSSPGFTNAFGINPSPANFIASGKRPLSSMTPSIIVDRKGDVKLVIGASGATKIVTAISLVTIRKLWFGKNIKEAVDEARMHHQIFPMLALYEFGVTEDIIKGLRAKGHGMRRYRERGSIICAIYKNKTAIYANADFRKGGDVAGIN